MNDLKEFFGTFSTLSPEVLKEVLAEVSTVKLKKGEFLLKEKQVCKSLYFVNKGLLKTSFIKNDKEFIMRFFAEHVLFAEFDSFIGQVPSNFSIIALEPSSISLIGYDTLEKLCKKHHSVETFYRKLVSVATRKMIARISDMLEDNSTRRYTKFVKENRALVQRIHLGDLARYLGITQQSLSRIRAGK